MEIDFTKKDEDSISNDSNYDPKHSSCYDLMEIEYPQNMNVHSGQSEIGKRKKSASISGTLSLRESSRVSQPVPITRRYDGPDSDGYMSMKPVGSSDSKHSTTSLTFQRGVNNSSISSSPTKYASRTAANISSPAATHRNIQISRTHQNSTSIDDYLNMSPINVRSSATPKVSSQTSQQQHHQQPPTQLQLQLQQQQQQQKQPTTAMHHVGSGSAPEGYMEMSWNNRSQTNNNSNSINNNNNNVGHVTLERNRQSSSSSISSSNEYINMNYGGNIPRTSSASSDCSSTSSIEIPIHLIESRNSRMRSLPITIKKSHQQSQPATNTAISKQTITNQPQNHPVLSFAATKMVPPSFLSLNTNIKPTTPQTLTDWTSECSNTMPTGDTTPHNTASTIFPFSPNSPNCGVNKPIFSSQSKQLPCDEQKRKCFVDGTTGKNV